ncbi:MAG: hypothetical protein HY390_03755 [Deltaproteobacteria bacterium]|nr:hypothetical protein [Deltaproteobacteria bacterium]
MKAKEEKRPKDIAYLDTNVISFYFDTRPEIQWMRNATRQWWEKRKQDFYVCTSEAVVGELEDGGYLHQPEAVKLVKSIAVLPGNDSVDNIAQYYIEHYLAPKENIQRFRGDAIHLAICAFYHVDYLLTWNLKHLANVNKFRQLKIMNARMDLSTPIITTPAQLLEETI